MTSLRHRGPDDHGDYQQSCQVEAGSCSAAGVALGFRRLAIIDLKTGNQPLGNEDNSIQIIKDLIVSRERGNSSDYKVIVWNVNQVCK